jgi:endonuclease/exonuclease/phosphatase family metal-dependent hydrolase
MLRVRTPSSSVSVSPNRPAGLIPRALAVLVATCGFAAAVSAQTTVTLSTPGSQVNADVTIQGGAYASADFSTSTVLATKVSSASYTRRILLKIDTQNTIPANAVIQSAQLYLVLKNAASTERRGLTAFNVTKSFEAGQTTWFNRKDGLLWASSGGDLGASFGTTYVDAAEGSAYKFNLTALVQRAVNGDFGSRYTRVALVDRGAQSDGSYKEFYSTRTSTAALRPRLVITYGAAAAPVVSGSTGTTSATTLRVMQWNIHKTKGSDGRCDPDRIANAIVAQHPDVVSLNEVNFFSGECAWTFDMGARLESLVEQKTGMTWYRQNVNGLGGTSGYGNVLLSRYKPSSSSATLISYDRGIAHMAIVVNGRTVNLFSTHVEYVNSSWRPIQIAEVVRWVKSFAEPRIVMGDFNTNPGTTDYNLMSSWIPDSWVAAQRIGTATSYNGTGATHGSSRFDYAFVSKLGPVTVHSAKVPDTRVGSVSPSDHDPLVVVFDVK